MNHTIYTATWNRIYGLCIILLFGCANENASISLHVQEGYEVEIVAGPNLVDYPMFATLDEYGRLFVFESIGNVYQTSQQAIDTPVFRIKLLWDEDEDGLYDRATIFADSLSFPQGGVFYQGSLYASSAPDLLKLTDTNDDGIADKKEIILSGWTLNVNANSLIGPFMGPDGWLYMTSAIEGFDVTNLKGNQLKGETARIWRIRPDGSDLQWVSAGGMNNPVELAFTPSGEVLGTQTFFVYPQRGLRDAITYWTEGGIYGKESGVIDRDQLPRTGDLMPVVAQYSRVAPSGIGRYRNTILGEDFKDNFFTVQFNTHQVLRHNIQRAGGSFTLENEAFLWTENTDFHPTDVLESGDGSLLVVETGGWFILGCPLSQVSKPQLKGGIYRIRKKDAPKIEDPYGNNIEWESLNVDNLISYIEDPRPFVVDRAMEGLIAKRDASVESLSQLLINSESEDIRTRVVFALYRMGTPSSFSIMRKGLKDHHEQVRIASARVAGLAKDQEATDDLIELLLDHIPAVQRQAATALGQIGDSRAIDALLEATHTDDRFVFHAATYALISMPTHLPIVKGLEHSSPKVRKASLIALDQRSGTPLQVDQFLPFLTSNEQDLQQTALWVAAHHPEWSNFIIQEIHHMMSSGNLSEQEEQLIENVLVSFCGNAEVQTFVSNQLKVSARDEKIFLIKSMSNCDESDFPTHWINSLKSELTQMNDPEVISAILDVVRLYGLEEMALDVAQMADNVDHPVGIRVNAISSLVEFNPEFQQKHFDFLLSELKSTENVPIRQRIARMLVNGRLEEEQVTEIASQYLPVADNFTLPLLVPLFKGDYALETGQSLIDILQESPVLDNFTEENIRSVFADYPSEITPKVDQLIEKLNAVRTERLNRITALESKLHHGDEARGRELYFGKATCWTCHTMREEGIKLGPDLTSIQADRSTHDILEAILYPGASFVREYETYEVQTENNTYLGIIQKQSPETLVLGLGPQSSIRLQRKDIQSIELKDISMMPSGFGELLTEQEMVDLVSFLLGNDLIY